MNYLEKLHIELISIMDSINEFCKENSIKYYLVGGTLLGALRHNGFIPWDDDLDIAMPRADYDRFVSLFPKFGNNSLFVESHKTCDSFIYGFAKVYKKGTTFQEAGGYNNPIFVDVFPLDESIGYSKKIDNTKKWYRRLETMRLNRLCGSVKSAKDIASLLIGNFSYKTILNITICKDNDKGYDYYTNYLSQYSAKRQTMKKAWYGEGTPVEFEGRKYIAPTEYHKFLNQLYGSHYMDIPPIEKRRTHYPLYVKFSDGEELYFNEPEKRVIIEETLQ